MAIHLGVATAFYGRVQLQLYTESYQNHVRIMVMDSMERQRNIHVQLIKPELALSSRASFCYLELSIASFCYITRVACLQASFCYWSLLSFLTFLFPWASLVTCLFSSAAPLQSHFGLPFFLSECAGLTSHLFACTSLQYQSIILSYAQRVHLFGPPKQIRLRDQFREIGRTNELIPCRLGHVPLDHKNVNDFGCLAFSAIGCQGARHSVDGMNISPGILNMGGRDRWWWKISEQEEKLVHSRARKKIWFLATVEKVLLTVYVVEPWFLLAARTWWRSAHLRVFADPLTCECTNRPKRCLVRCTFSCIISHVRNEQYWLFDGKLNEYVLHWNQSMTLTFCATYTKQTDYITYMSKNSPRVYSELSSTKLTTQMPTSWNLEKYSWKSTGFHSQL